MFQGMTAFLEAIDEKVEQHAQDHVAGAEPMTMMVKKNGGEEWGKGKKVHEVMFNYDKAGEKQGGYSCKELSKHHKPVCFAAPHVKENNVLLPKFPSQPPMQYEKTEANDLYRTVALPEKKSDGGHIAEGVMAALTMGQDVESSSLLRRRDEEIDALKQDVRRHQAIGEAARQELLRRSLQVHQLEEELRCTKSRFDEHKTKSLCLLEKTQRQCEALRRRLAAHSEDQNNTDTNNCVNVNCKNSDVNAEAAALRERLEEMEIVAASMKQEHEQLQAQVVACRRELGVAQEERHGLAQQLEFVRLDLRGAQEALDSELAAHRESKALLHRRQQELNELRAAVEKNGGTFTSAGALVSLRGNDLELRDQLLMSRQLLEKQNALEAALREAAEWRRRCERTAHKLEEERTTRVNVGLTSSSLQTARETVGFRQDFLKRASSANTAISLPIKFFAAVDAAALRFGRLLRRQPILRIAATFYIFCLHGWFLIALFMMFTPEVK